MAESDKFPELVKALRDAGYTVPPEVHDYTTLVIAIKANPPRNVSGDDLDDGRDPFGLDVMQMSTTRPPNVSRGAHRRRLDAAADQARRAARYLPSFGTNGTANGAK